MKVSCSSGTYIRALARDWGKAIGSAAHVRSLRRTKSGVFDIAECLSFEQIEQFAASGAWEHIIAPPGPALEKAIGRTTIVEGQDERRFLNGAPIFRLGDVEGISVVFSRERELLGIGKTCAGVFRPVLVYPSL
ncbi:MAG: tRNA pseudouridine synthase B [Candidatus Latescibacteria bacterium ADurb.Bin168]|nr:MAG: tRNA pseudouridine synthase B [Candidatus Latescibacteria bacterium ADurb.Bin168]